MYYACINNNVIDTSHFTSEYAGETEQAVQAAYLDKKSRVFATLRDELTESCSPYEILTEEYQAYESYIASTLYERDILMEDVVDTKDETYIAWTKDEVISLNEYLNYAIAQNWINVAKLDIDSRYSDSVEIYNKILDYIFDILDRDVDFDKISNENLNMLITTGIRVYDISLRFKYADIKVDYLTHDMAEAVRKCLETDSEVVYVLVNYTALFGTRNVLKRLEGEK